MGDREGALSGGAGEGPGAALPALPHRHQLPAERLLAGGGRGKVRVLDEQVDARRANNAFYRERLGGLPGLTFMPEAPGCRSTFWLTCLQIDPDAIGATRGDLRLALEAANIESRPVWKPMHLQPILAEHPVVGGKVAEELFERGLCLPSDSSMTDEDRKRVVDAILRAASRFHHEEGQQNLGGAKG